MVIFRSIAIAFEMLRQHKLRAFLTMLGVIIGVMSVTMIVMVSNGFQAYIQYQFQKLGSDTIFMFYDPGRRGHGQNVGGVEGLTEGDVSYLRQRVKSIDLYSAIVNVPAQQVSYQTKTIDNPKIDAVDQYFNALNHLDLVSGEIISKQDIDSYADVCVIGKEVVSRLFGTSNPIGKQITSNGIILTVKGVLASAQFMGDTTDRVILVPVTTAQKKWVGGNTVDTVLMSAKKGYSTDVAMQDVWAAMMARDGNLPVFRIDSSQSVLGVFNGIIGTGGAILAAIAALSLLVGGIGIMNIMLVSVTERTREIGLRKAVGARRSAILVQFLIESAVLSLVGGLIGMFIAWNLGQLVGLVTVLKKWPNANGLSTPFPITAAIMAALFSAAIGMVFGFYPAMTASKLDPIVALRSE